MFALLVFISLVAMLIGGALVSAWLDARTNRQIMLFKAGVHPFGTKLKRDE
jgi:hypothetical protein